jgi:hypothetical protein
MYYKIPKELTLNGFFAGFSSQLLAGGKTFIRQVYPN